MGVIKISDFMPAPIPDLDKRESKRVSFYKGDFPVVKIEFAGREYLGDIYDISTRGICVLPREEIPGLDSLEQTVLVQFSNIDPRPAVLRNIGFTRFSGSYRLKLGMEMPKTKVLLNLNTKRYHCAESMPLAYFDDPIAFNRRILLNVEYFTNEGLGFRVRPETAAFFAGLRLEVQIMMPARGEFRSVVEVVEVSEQDGYCELHCSWLSCPEELHAAVAEFLLMTIADLTISDLRIQSFSVASIERAFIFNSAKDSEDVNRILDLRMRAAQADGRWLGETDSSKMEDNWDKHARQIFCEVNGKVIGSGRIVFNNGLKDRCEHTSYGVEIPEWLWKEGFVEGSRVCTDPTFRGSDVFVLLLQHMSKIVTQSGFRYLVINCEDSLVPIYKKMAGVSVLGIKFHTAYMQKKTLNLLCIDIRSSQVSINAAPTTWVAAAPVGDYLIARGLLRLNFMEQLLRPFFAVLHRKMRSVYLSKKLKKKAQSRSRRLKPR